jgi:hypothetical protein
MGGLQGTQACQDLITQVFRSCLLAGALHRFGQCAAYQVFRGAVLAPLQVRLDVGSL